MIQKASYVLPGTVKYESSFPSHVDINAKQAHQNNRNHTGSPKGVWGQAQIASTTSWFMAAFYFLLYLQEYVLSPVPFAISEVVPANGGGERWMQKVGFLLSWQQWEGTGPWPGWGPTIASAWVPHWGLLQRLEKLVGGFAGGTQEHLPEEQGRCWDVLLSSCWHLISTDTRPLWLPADGFSSASGSRGSAQHHHLP